MSSAKFLGVVSSAKGILLDPDKVTAIRSMRHQTDVHRARRLLGLLNHFGRFLTNLSATTAPIRLHLNKDMVWTWEPLSH